jgi:hypothetical protein
MRKRAWYAAVAAVLVAVAVVAFVSYSSVSPSGTPRQRLARWVADTSLGQDLGALHDDGLDLKKVLAHHAGTTAVHTVCSVLSVTAEAANSNLPSPDTTLTQLLARAYGLEGAAGGYCYDAGASDRPLLEKSEAEQAQAQRLIDEALARVAAITGATVSTTTTTQPTSGTGIFG